MAGGLRVTFVLDRRALSYILAVAAALIPMAELGSENITIATTYPSPSGIYNQIVTVGRENKNTILARDGGFVGIGTPTPESKLHVFGTTRTGSARVEDRLVVGNHTQVGGELYVGQLLRANGGLLLPAPTPRHTPDRQCLANEYVCGIDCTGVCRSDTMMVSCCRFGPPEPSAGSGGVHVP